MYLGIYQYRSQDTVHQKQAVQKDMKASWVAWQV